MRKKVYCINCKYAHLNSGNSQYNRCCALKNITFVKGYFYDTPMKKEYSDSSIIFKHNPNELNEHNKCKYYKRKWYKFWVKIK